MSIYLFSRPIHSGKTTLLMQWCRQQENIQGILMPDIHGQRMMVDIASQTMFPAQCIDKDTNQELISIGRYVFFNDAFKRANIILLQSLQLKPSWLVIDEIGKLEMEGRGFYESAKQLIDHYKYCDKNLLLVVRNDLVSEVVRFFDIKSYTKINELGK